MITPRVTNFWHRPDTSKLPEAWVVLTDHFLTWYSTWVNHKQVPDLRYDASQTFTCRERVGHTSSGKLPSRLLWLCRPSTMASKRTPTQIAMRRIQVPHSSDVALMVIDVDKISLQAHIAPAFLQSELTDWLLDDRRPEGCRLESFEPLLNWVIVIEAPKTPPYLYRGQNFRFFPACSQAKAPNSLTSVLTFASQVLTLARQPPLCRLPEVEASCCV